MKPANWKQRLIKPVFITVLLAAMLASATACEELGYPSSSPSTDQETAAETTTPFTAGRSKDSVTLAVYQHLLSQAKGYEAKQYLADFYANCDNWSAVSEYFKDGSATWCVTVNMTAVKDWAFPAYWQQASWFVIKDGSVIPAHLSYANALRIEADLQALSPEPDEEATEDD